MSQFSRRIFHGITYPFAKRAQWFLLPDGEARILFSIEARVDDGFEVNLAHHQLERCCVSMLDLLYSQHFDAMLNKGG
jgi:hypothetical protein